MREAARTRRAAVEATADVEPTALREYITDMLQTESMTPGAVTIACADGSGDESLDLVDRAAGVQLIYDGLRLTRHLATTEPWDADSRAEGDADLRILAADILVARGFALLARTPAAKKAVETVRSTVRDGRLEKGSVSQTATGTGARTPATSDPPTPRTVAAPSPSARSKNSTSHQNGTESDSAIRKLFGAS